MSTSLKFYTDATLTTELTTHSISTLFSGSSPDVDRVVYLGSIVSAVFFKATSDPGVDQVTVSFADLSPGSGVEASNMKLALSSGGLDGAVAGASLDVGTQIASGVGNAVAIHVRSDAPALSVTDNDITANTNPLTESP